MLILMLFLGVLTVTIPTTLPYFSGRFYGFNIISLTITLILSSVIVGYSYSAIFSKLTKNKQPLITITFGYILIFAPPLISSQNNSSITFVLLMICSLLSAIIGGYIGKGKTKS